MRDVLCSAILKIFSKKPKEKKLVFLTADLGFKALEPLREKLGNHFINVGISEQNMIALAAGIAKTGLQVFCYSIAPFAYARPFEQIRNDICLHNLPVTIIGNGGGYGYGVMGATHHAIEDYGVLATLQNMQVFVPAFDDDVLPIIKKITKLKRPSYLRLGTAKKTEKISYAPWRKILDGNLGVIIICGAIASDLFMEFKNDKIEQRPAIWLLCEFPIISVLPKNLIAEINNKKLCIVEEHVAQGGIGQMIAAQILAQKITVKSFLHLHALGYVSGFYGSQNFHRHESNLTKKSILKFLQK
ncbi:MAG: hypothetical protein SFV53_02520 [Rickettsiales bacterium]|nr:hypothetical protein [Rickettsiales bacterium]